MADLVGQLLGHYRLLRLLGRGGFSEVYLGEHLSLKTLAAIKVLNTRLVNDDVEEFLKEARTVAHLIHPQIVRIFDFEVQHNTPFLVMDYAPNDTLRQRHPKGVQIPLPSIIDYIKQVTDALQYAHDQKIIHRDIKPENMLIGRRNEILLSDFGIALIVQTTRLQNTQEVVGTAYYMAPEQFQGKPRFSSDQYSLGIVVYEWLTGSRPFNGSFHEIVSQHMLVSPPPLHEKFPYISLEVEQVVMIALAKDPQNRFANISAFATALEEASRSSNFFVPAASSLSVTWPSKTLLSDQSISPATITSTQLAMSSQQNIPSSTMTPQGHLTSQFSIVTPPNLSSQLTSPVKSLPQASSDKPHLPKKSTIAIFPC